MSAEEQVDYEDAGDDIYYNDNEQNDKKDIEGDANHRELSAEDISNIRDRRRLGNSQGVVEHVLFISRFSPETTKQDIKDLFAPFGSLGDINIMTNIAFIDFANAEDASKAKFALHHRPGLGCESLIVDFKKLPGRGDRGGGNDRNSRGGGGDRGDGYRERDGASRLSSRGGGSDRERDNRSGGGPQVNMIMTMTMHINMNTNTISSRYMTYITKYGHLMCMYAIKC